MELSVSHCRVGRVQHKIWVYYDTRSLRDTIAIAVVVGVFWVGPQLALVFLSNSVLITITGVAGLNDLPGLDGV